MTELDQRTAAARQTFWILVVISSWMTAWITWRLVADPRQYVERSLGINESFAGVATWIWLPTLGHRGSLRRVHTVGCTWCSSYVLRLNALGVVAIWAAVVSGILEEVLFRQRLMDWLDGLGHSTLTQVLISAGAFGAAHALWVFMASDWRIVVPVVGSTTALGLTLAALYIAADRSTLPAIVAHTIVNLVIEPGLIATACLAGIRASQTSDSGTGADVGRNAT